MAAVKDVKKEVNLKDVNLKLEEEEEDKINLNINTFLF
jgi:hypothetical protein